jgi:hypothetical protein
MQIKTSLCVLALAGAAVAGVALSTQQAAALPVDQVVQSTTSNNVAFTSMGRGVSYRSYRTYRGYGYGYYGYHTYRTYRGYGYGYGYGYYGYGNYRGYSPYYSYGSYVR